MSTDSGPLAAHRSDVSPLSLRPHRPVKVVAETWEPPPTDLPKLVYSKQWMYSNRLSESVEPESDMVIRMKDAQIWRCGTQQNTNSNSNSASQVFPALSLSSSSGAINSQSSQTQPSNTLVTSTSLHSSSPTNSNNSASNAGQNDHRSNRERRGSSGGSRSNRSGTGRRSSGGSNNSGNGNNNTVNNQDQQGGPGKSGSGGIPYSDSIGSNGFVTGGDSASSSSSSSSTPRRDSLGSNSQSSYMGNGTNSSSSSSASINSNLANSNSSLNSNFNNITNANNINGSNLTTTSSYSNSRPRIFIGQSVKLTDAQKICSELLGLLNKLTVEKFDKLSTLIVKQFDSIQNADVLTEAIKTLHTKSLKEHAFCPMYADLIKLLDKPFPFEESNSVPTNPSSSMTTSTTTSTPTSTTKKAPPPTLFRRTLLNTCFYTWEQAIEGKVQLVGDEELVVNQRYRVIGNMILMGELYKRQLLVLAVLKSSTAPLIDKIRHALQTENPQIVENSVPFSLMLANLIKTVGDAMDKDPNKNAKTALDGYMEALKEFVIHKSLPKRIGLLFRNLLDDRKNGWLPRLRLDTPMTLNEVKDLQEADAINPIFTVSSMHLRKSSGSDKSNSNITGSPSSPNISSRSSKSGINNNNNGNNINVNNNSNNNVYSNVYNNNNSNNNSSTTPGRRSSQERKDGRRKSSGAANSIVITSSSPTSSPSSSSFSSASSTREIVPSASSGSLQATKSLTTSIPFPASLVQSYFNGTLHDEQNPSDNIFDWISLRISEKEEYKEEFISALFNWILDQSSKEQLKITGLLKEFTEMGIITSQDISNGITAIVSNLEEISLDVPHAPIIIGRRIYEASQEKLISSDNVHSINAVCPSRFSEKFIKAISGN